MRKKISVSVLVIVIASLMVIGVGGSLNNSKKDLIDIKGEKENLGDVLFLQQSRVDLYKNIQTFVSKDGFKVEEYKNIKNFKSKLSKTINSNKDLFKNNLPNKNSVYTSNNNIGFLEEHRMDYGKNGEVLNDFIIHNKNLKTNEITNYVFSMPDEFKSESNFHQWFTVDIKEDYVYILYSAADNVEYDRGGNVKNIGNSYLNLYTFNLNTQEVKKKDSYQISNKNEEKIIVDGSIGFKDNDRLYTFIKKVDLNNEEKSNYYLVYYDINSNKFNTINKPVIEDYNESYLSENITYDVEGDFLYLLQNTVENGEGTVLKLSTINLKTNEVIDIDKKYRVDSIYDNFNIKNFRIIDNKMYMCINSWKDNDRNDGKNDIVKDSILVIDEKNGQVLYQGEYLENIPGYKTELIITKDEL
ncbi:hypothetical protein [Paraclostridium sordellii]|uniref:Uncharacterized protein n=1 Tax=Paraclostridium sordellii TaxID=1505 RepID=A0A0C7G919_PARSO|nr:hypothetical protein [Paeniclostridium sordellii]CEN21458.1 Uncharacterised protein [[Clostridium] sordellii] [Paeniclostridium sordellii]CEN79212.1 Uncharacterised protein [[Clostridium] sordellii] [Paeniclostridium sordellii]CEP88304.1 Uncharacterised protein [[Clostridium] sordellii] [Paeniclostridium sordellii]CEP97047.1 Uncharacterised protein [[Clostridium] sordellii] [Paeniclostridium sordellii]CEQ00735.1 Uncharacterised protein [[Clostridium] sordellii] [Paeniclostridium sordellii]